MKEVKKVVNISNLVEVPVVGTSALKPQIMSKPKTRSLKREYVKPKAKFVGMSTQKSPVMGCWNCGSDGMHC